MDSMTAASLGAVDRLAAEIRRVDGSHTLGAGALAEALWPFIAALTPAAARADGVVERFDTDQPVVAVSRFVDGIMGGRGEATVTAQALFGALCAYVIGHPAFAAPPPADAVRALVGKWAQLETFWSQAGTAYGDASATTYSDCADELEAALSAAPAGDGCTEPNRAACPRMCMDFCNKAETAAAPTPEGDKVEQIGALLFRDWDTNDRREGGATEYYRRAIRYIAENPSVRLHDPEPRP